MGSSREVPHTRDKGKVGKFIENICGIPTSSACLDCIDGEVKVFPLKQLKTGEIVPKETIAITMFNTEAMLNTPDFRDTRIYKKISSVLFIPYLREGSMCRFYPHYLFELNSHPSQEIINAD